MFFFVFSIYHLNGFLANKNADLNGVAQKSRGVEVRALFHSFSE
jgi:hypothetical protein